MEQKDYNETGDPDVGTDSVKQLSIVIPHYNSPSALEILLNSILSEANDAVEIIVSDDRSDKYLEEYAQLKTTYEDKVIFTSNQSPNKGAGAARNQGLTIASGKWLMFADADDYFLPGWFECVKGYFSSDSDIIYFDPTSEYEDHTLSSRHVPYKNAVEGYDPDDEESSINLRYTFVVPWSKMIRREVVVSNRIQFEEILYSNDVVFSTKAAFLSDKITADSRTIYCVTDSTGTLTKKKGSRVYKTRFLAECRRHQFVKDRIPGSVYHRIWKCPFIFGAMITCFRNKYPMSDISEILSAGIRYGLPFYRNNNKTFDRIAHRAQQ